MKRHAARSGRRLRVASHAHCARNERDAAAGFTLVELVVTLIVLSILTMGVAPLVKIAVQRQREQQLRESLREMRDAIKQFKYDTDGTPQLCGQGNAQLQNQQPQNPQQQIPPQLNSRSRVIVTDCKVFNTDNPDYFPPSLEALVEGVNVVPRGGAGATGGKGIGGNTGQATDSATLATKKKVYLRKIPIDPMTGEADWELRSSYDEADSGSWGRENVFDVRSKSDGTALNGEKYSDW